ncbi:MAG TPA: hypothetical protein VMV49_05075 [Candidatus Deferrimicrobium sp.]|nr:hypothetical protein [Candidatus Deferrimicrobium sp.]
MVHTYGEMPDDLYLKPFLPLLSFLWRVYKKLGWQGVDNYEAMGDKAIFDFFETRLNESIYTVKDVLDGKITQPDKVLSYIIMIPSIVIRSDLVIGTQRLFGGDSMDVTFAVVHDYNAELLILLNCHIEDGIPVDWYMVRQEDELLDRRHMKYGYKLREIPQRLKSLPKSANMLMEVLKDVRNERTPQWAKSDYYVGTVISSWAINLMCIPSNYESIGETFDGRASKDSYGLPDYTFSLHPFPSAFNMFFYKGRSEFCKIVASLTTQMEFYVQPFEPHNLEIIRTRVPELFAIYKDQIENEGIPFPIQTINSNYPNMKSKDPNIRFDKHYPPGDFLKPSDLDLTLEDFLSGVYLDVNHETPAQKIDASKIKSTGIGRSTVFKY